jgi:RNA polymerase sporulation-specific sigma factor
MDQVRDEGARDDNWVEDIALKSALERLSDRERRIIRLRFFNGRTQMEIAEEIGISQAQVSRLEKAALDKIRRMM